MGYSKKLQNVLGVTSSIISEVLLCNNAYDKQKIQKPLYSFVSFAQTTPQILLL